MPLKTFLPVCRANAALGHCLVLLALLANGWPVATARAATPTASGALAGDPIQLARAAYARGDRGALANLRRSTAAAGHPLAPWVDYWEINLRLRQARQADLDAFYARWPGTLVEERLRRDWILERGKHRDPDVLAAELPRVRVFDDREVECYSLLLRHQAGEAVAPRARELWFAQREADHGCAQLAGVLFKAGQLGADDLWARARLAAEQGRRFPAQHAVGLLGNVRPEVVHQIFMQPSRFLSQRTARASRDDVELTLLAIIRLAARSPKSAAAALLDARSAAWPAPARAAAWAALAREAAIDQLPQALDWYQRSSSAAGGSAIDSSAATLAWKVRAALRAEGAEQRWPMIIEAVDAMSPDQRTDPTWSYWKARALKATAPAGPAGEARRRAAKQLFDSVASSLNFYGRLAAEGLGRPLPLPEAPPPLSSDERAAAQADPSLTRGIELLALRLREEGLAEWLYGLRGMNDRSLRAAAQRACDAQIWNLCMSTSERTQVEIDMAQRFPTPFRDLIDVAARESGLETAQLYAVIRQESHFSVGVRSSAGAAGLMQVMPLTAHSVAARYRIPYRRELIAEPTINVRIGARYLKLVLNQFQGSQVLAAAAYNAGPSRPRRWLRAGVEDAVAWTEIIPLAETRDYVKNVLSNAACYSALLGGANIGALRLADTVRLRPAQLQLAEIEESDESELPAPR